MHVTTPPQISLPSLAEVKAYIKKLDQTSWKEYDGQNIDDYKKEMHERITSVIEMFLSILTPFTQSKEFQFKIFRVRKYNDIHNKMLRMEYSYPPAHLVTRNLRANVIGHPVFYASDHPLAALLEYLQEWNDPKTYTQTWYAVSSWGIRPEHTYFVAPFIPQSLAEENYMAILGKGTREQYQKPFGANISDDQVAALNLLGDYFSNLFITDSHRSISSYLAYYYLYDLPSAQGLHGHKSGHPILIYPSSKAKFRQSNFAFHPNFVDEFMFIKHVYLIKVDSINDKIDDGANFMYTTADRFWTVNGGKFAPASLSKNWDVMGPIYKEEWGTELDFSTANNGLIF